MSMIQRLSLFSFLLLCYFQSTAQADLRLGAWGGATYTSGVLNGKTYDFGAVGGLLARKKVWRSFEIDLRGEYQFLRETSRTILGQTLSGAQFHYLGGTAHLTFFFSRSFYIGAGASYLYLFSESLGGSESFRLRPSIIPLGLEFRKWFIEFRWMPEFSAITTHLPFALQIGWYLYSGKKK